MSKFKKALKKSNPTLFYIIFQFKRNLILKHFYSLDDNGRRALVEKQYLANIGRHLNWDNLEAYTEKMQWEKLYHQDGRKVRLSDKYLVRTWVKERVGEEYLIPLLGVWDNAEKIDFNSLPSAFVLKTNCSSGDAVIIRDKSKLTKKEILTIRKQLNHFLNYDISASACELHYAKITPKIVAETFIDSGQGDLLDYKFICFDGKPYYCWVDMNRFSAHRRNVYDMNWNLQDWQITYPPYDGIIEKPKNFDKMIEIARKLSDGFAHVRVDLYNVNGKIYFGEMTFTSETGYGKITPDEMDFSLGKLWHIQ